jgi:hypothetical protein
MCPIFRTGIRLWLCDPARRFREPHPIAGYHGPDQKCSGHSRRHYPFMTLPLAQALGLAVCAMVAYAIYLTSLVQARRCGNSGPR